MPKKVKETETKQSRLILPATDKGGCGKSFATSTIYRWLQIENYDVLGFDPDSSTQTFTKYYPEEDIIPINVHSPSSIDQMITKLVEKNADVSIVDGLGSEQTKTFSDWADQTAFFEIKDQLGIKITYTLCIEETPIIIDQVEEIIDKVGNQVDWVVIYTNKEHEHPLPPEQSIWFNEDSTRNGVRKKALDLGAKEIVIPFIHPEIRKWIFQEFMNCHEASLLDFKNPVPLMDKQRFRIIWRDITNQLESAKDLLS